MRELRCIRYSTLEPLPTLAMFCREHPSGLFYCVVRGHAIAVINGTPYGYYGMRSRVLWASQVEFISSTGSVQEITNEQEAPQCYR